MATDTKMGNGSSGVYSPAYVCLCVCLCFDRCVTVGIIMMQTVEELIRLLDTVNVTHHRINFNSEDGIKSLESNPFVSFAIMLLHVIYL